MSPDLLLALLLGSIAGLFIVRRYRERWAFGRFLAGASCPWCGRQYGEAAARESMTGQSVRGRAFTVKCLSCGRVQILTGGKRLSG